MGASPCRLPLRGFRHVVDFTLEGTTPMPSYLAALETWGRRRWTVAAIASASISLLIAVPTAVFPSNFFTRSMAVTWWSYPVLAISGILTGLLMASYVRQSPATSQVVAGNDHMSEVGLAGGVLTFLAVGCPICNKLVVLALGVSGATTWFAPFQPVLALGSLGLLVFALRIRLRNEYFCEMPSTPSEATADRIPRQ